jgi:hypothetical protein
MGSLLPTPDIIVGGLLKKNMNKEILLASYWEHFKYAKELAMYLSIDNPKRIKIEKAVNEISEQLKK